MTDEPSLPVLLMIAERFPPDLGGVARSAFRTAEAISQLGWNVHVLAWTKSLPPGELETVAVGDTVGRATGVTVHRLGLFSNWDFSMQHTANVLEWLYQEFRFSAAWGHYVYPAGYMAVVFAETLGLPSTVSARGNDIDRLMFPPGDFARLMWTLERATVVSCVSRDLAKKVTMLLGQQVEIVVVPNVVDTELFRPAAGSHGAELRGSLGIRPDEAVLGFCGELRHKKGLPFILAALLEVRQIREACLLVIGEVRPREQAHLAAFAGDHPEAAARIVVTGQLEHQSDVVRHFQLCDVVLQPSVWDGLPNAVLEAMACGNIVLASDAGGLPEAIEHGVNGFVIPKAQLNHLGTAILEVLDLEDDQREAIANAARDRITRSFHDELEAARLGGLLSRLVAKPRD
ncbi:MAG: glycosyltransferase [Pirellulaceae bacterium]|nr:glycosyl transferase family 1 [Planctomycetaceae bacterium]MDP6557777.1 glycosyltransferase [Pirellulaceae bacterium]